MDNSENGWNKIKQSTEGGKKNISLWLVSMNNEQHNNVLTFFD